MRVTDDAGAGLFGVGGVGRERIMPARPLDCGGAGRAMPDNGSSDRDPYLWLEEVEGAEALAWVTERNRVTHAALADRQPGFDALRERLCAAFDAEDRIPNLSKLGDRYYNFRQDETHPRGLWRRTTLEEYRKPAPAWEVVIDFDALGRAEGERWVFAGAPVLVPGYDRALVRLSRGGADAVVVREFDLVARRFVEAGFSLPESKGHVSWAGPNEIFVATDFGPGTMTTSGYPRIVKRWRRGQPLDEAATVFEGEASDVSVRAWTDLAPGFETELVIRARDFFNEDRFVRRDGDLIPLDVPSDAGCTVSRGRLFVTPRGDWETGGRAFPVGSLLAIGLARFLAGARDLAVLFAPTEGRVLAGFSPTRNHVLLNILDNVRHRIEIATPGAAGGDWTAAPLAGAGTDDGSSGFRSIDVRAVDADVDERYFLATEDCLTPPALALGSVGEAPPVVLKREPVRFDAEGLAVAQHWTTSADGTRIPYFEVSRPSHASGPGPAVRPRPTLLYAYGGFEVAETPRYLPSVGAAWLAPGGAYAVANIRGGGEFGPAWHRAAIKAGRPRAFEDFIAVAEDLIRRGVTTPPQLGILGGSNGGLLTGNMLTMRPDLFGAVVAHVPLFDMRRYHRLLAGASWMAEYGDPDDPGEWSFIRKFSPYRNVDAGADYPPLFITTSTRDDRVHPGHARKMAAKLRAMGHAVLYHENVEGGHAGAADNAQRAYLWALVFRFLWRTLGDSAAR